MLITRDGGEVIGQDPFGEGLLTPPDRGTCGRRGRAGQETLPEPARIGGEAKSPSFLAKAELYPHLIIDRSTYSKCQSSEVWCRPAGARKSWG